MLKFIDYAVLVFYFVFMGVVGWYFRRLSQKDSNEYFRGGGRMPWWLVGSSLFMASFSAWTFTGAAGLAFDRGFIALTISWITALGFFVIAALFAPWFRQMRTVTMIEAFRQRFGPFNQQLTIWLGLPLSIVTPAIWLYGLGIFLSPVFKLDLNTLIICSGLTVSIVACMGGSWGVYASDFVQALLLVPVTIVAAWFALDQVGGVQSLLHGLPREHFDLLSRHLPGYGWLWLSAVLVLRIIGQGIGSNGKLLSVADRTDARRTALLAGGLMLVGSLVWFIPPLAARAMGINVAAQFPGINKPEEASYAAMAVITLPPGVLGLLVSALIAATLSSMDSGLNAHAGTLVRGLYLPVFRPKASELELVLAGRIVTLFFGGLIILLSLVYTTWKDMGVFALMYKFAAMLTIPGAVPGFWAFFTRRSPDWAYWSTMLFGLCLGLILGSVPRTDWFHAWAVSGGFAGTLNWFITNEFAAILFANFILCSAWFWIATWIARRHPLPAERQAIVDEFFATMRRPLPKNPRAPNRPDGTALAIGRMCYCYGGFIVLIALFPNSARGHSALAACAAFFFAAGYGISWAVKRAIRRAQILEAELAKAAVENQTA